MGATLWLAELRAGIDCGKPDGITREGSREGAFWAKAFLASCDQAFGIFSTQVATRRDTVVVENVQIIHRGEKRVLAIQSEAASRVPFLLRGGMVPAQFVSEDAGQGFPKILNRGPLTADERIKVDANGNRRKSKARRLESYSSGSTQNLAENCASFVSFERVGRFGCDAVRDADADQREAGNTTSFHKFVMRSCCTPNQHAGRDDRPEIAIPSLPVRKAGCPNRSTRDDAYSTQDGLFCAEGHGQQLW